MRPQPYQPKTLQRWRNYANYDGEDFSRYYVVLWVPETAGPRQRIGFWSAERQLRADTPERHQDAIITPVFSDHYYGFRTYLLVRDDCSPALRTGDWIAEDIADGLYAGEDEDEDDCDD